MLQTYWLSRPVQKKISSNATSNLRNATPKFKANVQESDLDYLIQDSSFPIEDNNVVLYKDFLKFMHLNQTVASSYNSYSVINFAGILFVFNATCTQLPSNKHV